MQFEIYNVLFVITETRVHLWVYNNHVVGSVVGQDDHITWIMRMWQSDSSWSLLFCPQIIIPTTSLYYCQSVPSCHSDFKFKRWHIHAFPSSVNKTVKTVGEGGATRCSWQSTVLFYVILNSVTVFVWLWSVQLEDCVSDSDSSSLGHYHCDT